MTVIVNDPIDLEKLENGHLKLRPMITDVGSIIHEAIDHYALWALENNIIIDTEIQPNLPAVFIDGHRVAQVIQNLLSNAINATRDGEIRIAADYATGMETGFRSATGSPVPALTISIQDDGSGIAVADQAHIFARSGQTQEPARQDMRLGLALCKLLTEAMGGTIGFQSLVNEGTTFWFNIPAPVNDQSHEPAGTAVNSENDDPMLINSATAMNSDATLMAAPLDAWAAALKQPIVDLGSQQDLRDMIGAASVNNLLTQFIERLDNFRLLAEQRLVAGHAGDGETEQWSLACHDMKGMTGSLGLPRLAALSMIMDRCGWPLETEKGAQEDLLNDLVSAIDQTRQTILTTSTQENTA